MQDQIKLIPLLKEIKAVPNSLLNWNRQRIVVAYEIEDLNGHRIHFNPLVDLGNFLGDIGRIHNDHYLVLYKTSSTEIHSVLDRDDRSNSYYLKYLPLMKSLYQQGKYKIIS